MTIRGDMEAMICKRLLGRALSDKAMQPLIGDVLDWMVSADVLAVVEAEDVSGAEWCHGVEAIRRAVVWLKPE